METSFTIWSDTDAGQWTNESWVCRWMERVRIDPYLIWADVTNFAYLGGGKALAGIPVILELKTSAYAFAQEMRNEKWIHIPQVYRKHGAGLGQTKFCTARVSPAAFAQLDQLGRHVERFELGLPIATEIAPESEQAGLEPDLPQDVAAMPPRAVIAVIDDGLAVAHQRFGGWRGKPDSTRVRYYWQQDSRPQADGTPVRGMGYGTEKSKSDIDQALARSKRGGVIDEDEVYRRLRPRPSSARTSTHGASVMDLACGASSAEREAAIRDTDIICVELPRSTTADTSGASLAVNVLDALRYILDRADGLARAGRKDAPVGAMPVVVNLSYGNFAGPHDGSSMLEEAIDELIENRTFDEKATLAVVLPAGNSQLSRCHAKAALPRSDSSIEFQWHVLPDDATPSFMEIWPTPRERAEFEVQVVAPWGIESSWVRRGQVAIWPSRTDPLCMVSNLDRIATGKGAMALVCVAPTIPRPWDTAATVAPAGIWRVRVRNAGSESLTVDAWIQRDDAIPGFPRRGRQSHFVDKDYERYDQVGREVETDPNIGPGSASYIKRDGTQNGIATGKRTIVVGGYRESDGAAASYSSSGDGKSVRGPDALAVSERSPGRRGVLTAGTRSGGSNAAISGTSAAAPQVARWIAEQTVKGKYVGRDEVNSEALKGDPTTHTPDPVRNGRKPKPSKARGGGGRLKREGRDRDES